MQFHHCDQWCSCAINIYTCCIYWYTHTLAWFTTLLFYSTQPPAIPIYDMPIIHWHTDIVYHILFELIHWYMIVHIVLFVLLGKWIELLTLMLWHKWVCGDHHWHKWYLTMYQTLFLWFHLFALDFNELLTTVTSMALLDQPLGVIAYNWDFLWHRLVGTGHNSTMLRTIEKCNIQMEQYLKSHSIRNMIH